MVKFKTFKGALGKIDSIIITKVQIPVTKSITAKTACFDKNTMQYRFFDKKGNEIVKFHQYDIRLISRLLTDDNDKFVFVVCLKNNDDYRMEFHMRDGCSFYVKNEYEEENIKSVITAVPRYLCDFKDKRVKVSRAISHEVFSTLNIDDGSEDSVVLESFVLNSMDYEIKTVSGIVVVNLLDKDSPTYTKVLGVSFIVGDVKDGVILGSDVGEYTLKILE